MIPQVTADIVFDLFAGLIRYAFGFKIAGVKFFFPSIRAMAGKDLSSPLHNKDNITAGGIKVLKIKSRFWQKTPFHLALARQARYCPTLFCSAIPRLLYARQLAVELLLRCFFQRNYQMKRQVN
jgi:hypothetical protein